MHWRGASAGAQMPSYCHGAEWYVGESAPNMHFTVEASAGGLIAGKLAWRVQEEFELQASTLTVSRLRSGGRANQQVFQS